MLQLIKRSESINKVPRKGKRAKLKQDTVSMSRRVPSRLLSDITQKPSKEFKDLRLG